MTKELQIVQGDMFLPEEQQQLNNNITAMLASYRDNKGEINRLVYDCYNALTEGEAATNQLSSKGRFSRIIGNITGNNQALQNKINENQKAAQFAAQQVLKKMAEQQLMSFEIISSVNMKLNASLSVVGKDVENLHQDNVIVGRAVKRLEAVVTNMGNELDQIYTGLQKFFRHNRNELVRIETRMDKIERNVNLLTWQNSIEYQEFDGEEYIDMDDAKKLVCLVSDFYDITRGSWSTTDLLLLKSAMAAVDMDPKQKVNYFGILKEIANDDALQQKLLGGGVIVATVDPAYLMSLGTLQKLDALDRDERYIVSTIADYMADQGSTRPEEAIRDDLTQKYMEQMAHVDIDMDVEAFDLMLDFLYTLQQAKEEHLLVSSQEEVQSLPVGERMPSVADEPVASISDEQKERLKEAEQLLLECKFQEAFDAFQTLAEEGNGRAMYFLGEFYRGSYGRTDYRNIVVEEDEEKGFSWHKKGAEAGDVLAKLKTAYEYDEEYEKRQKIINDVFEKVKELAENGDCFAQYELAMICDDEKQIIFWLRKSSEAGYWSSQLELGLYYLLGIYVDVDNEEGAKWIKKAAESGYAPAQGRLGSLYQDGDGIAKDDGKAAYWYQIAAAQGDGSAQYSLGNCYYYGNGIKKSYSEAVKWYQKAAEQNIERAQYSLAQCYANGEGVSRHERKAFYWFEKAAKQGLAMAQNSLALCYDEGKGVGEDDKQAVIWYRKAAEQGYAPAQCNLAMCYEYGEGIKWDLEEALYWYKKAADQGDEDAKKAYYRLTK